MLRSGKHLESQCESSERQRDKCVGVRVFLSGTRSHIVKAEHKDVGLGALSDLMVHSVCWLCCAKLRQVTVKKKQQKKTTLKSKLKILKFRFGQKKKCMEILFLPWRTQSCCHKTWALQWQHMWEDPHR